MNKKKRNYELFLIIFIAENERRTNAQMCMGDKFLFVPTGPNIHVLDTDDYSVVKSLTGHYSAVNCVTFNDHEQEMYSGGNDRNILVWESNTARNEAYNDHLAERGKTEADCDNQEGRHLPSTVTVDNWSSSDDEDDWDLTF